MWVTCPAVCVPRLHDPAAPCEPARSLATANALSTVLVCRRVGRLTRSARKARDIQWARDAVLNNPDLLCHIAQQTELPTACKLLTTSKQNLVGGGADFFDKQWIYYAKQFYYAELEGERLRAHWVSRQRDHTCIAYRSNRIAYSILTNEATQVNQEAEVLRVRVLQLIAYLELLCDYFGVKNTAFDKVRKAHGICCSKYCPCECDAERMFDCDCGTYASYCIKCGEPMDCPYCG